MIRRWFWLLLLASLISGATAYMIAREQPTTYEASSLLIVGPGIDSLSPDLDELRAAAQLMQTYAELATTKPVLQGVVDELQLSTSPASLARDVKTRADETTQILAITAESDDAVQAAEIANAIAYTLVRMSPSGVTDTDSPMKNQMRDQIDKMEQEVARLESNLAELNRDFQATDLITEQSLIAEKIARERDYLADARRTLASLYESFQGSYTNQVKIVETASIGEPLDSSFYLTVLMGTIAGLVIALAIALTFEYFKGTVDTSEELAHVTNIPTLGALAKHKTLQGVGRNRLIVLAEPGSEAAENYRMIGSRLLLSRFKAQHSDALHAVTRQDALLAPDGAKPLRSVLISGTYANDDTSEIAANLAVVLAQMHHRVILVDAQLYRPNLDKIFGISMPDGVVGTLTIRANEPIGTPITRSTKPKLIQIDGALDLSVLPGGPVPDNPFELLVSAHMAELIQELEQEADIVLITAPPLLSFAESLVLASRVDGVVLTARSGKTHRSVFKGIVESLHSLDVRIIGTILDHNSVNQPAAAATRKGSATPAEYELELNKGTQTPLRSVKL